MNDNQKQIGARMFSFGVIPPTEAIRVEVAIARVIGEPLFKAFTEAAKSGDGLDLDPQVAGATAIGLMTSKMDADELLKTMEIVFKYTSCDGQRVEINSHFAGKNRELWEVFLAGLKFNFADFLAESLFDSIRAKMAK